MPTRGPDTKIMRAMNTGRLIRVPYNTVWVSEIVVTSGDAQTGQ